MKYVKPIVTVKNWKKVTTLVPCAPWDKGAILVTTLLLFLTSLTTQAQIPSPGGFATPAEYVLPQDQQQLHQFESTTCFKVEMDGEMIEIVHFDRDSQQVLIQLFSTQVVYSYNEDTVMYNPLTGIRCFVAYTDLANDCGKTYVDRFRLYIRDVSKGYFLCYESPCEGINISLGDKMLVKAFNYKPKSLSTN